MEIGQVVYTQKGKSYRLINEKARGGEGTVFLVDSSNVVAKIYHNPSADIERKLKAMIENCLEPYIDGRLMIAWPMDVLYSDGKFVGYLMPLVKDTYPIYILCRNNQQHIDDCHEVFPDYDWRKSLVVAYHLAWVVEYIHEHGFVIGDMNSNNIVIHSDGSVTILDVDSFDIWDKFTGEHFKCAVGRPEFLPPELQGRNLRDESSRFDENTDDFALAIHIFQLLMNNYHPFVAKVLCEYKQSLSFNSQMMNIVQGNCPYVKNNPDYGLPVGAPSISMLPAKMQTAFRKTFGYDENTAIESAKNRVSAGQWKILLYDLYNRAKGDNPDLIRCSQNPEHFYLKSRHRCGLCAAGMFQNNQEHSNSNINSGTRESSISSTHTVSVSQKVNPPTKVKKSIWQKFFGKG